MSDYNEHTLMEAVIKRVAATPDPRLRQIMTSLVKHLHGFVREVRPTWEEWLAGIQFLTAVGHKCDDKRQEFILLSDSLGVSTLVDLISYGKVGNATESALLGPAWVEAAPELPLGSNLAKHPSDGEPCVITGSVASLDGTPLAGAMVDFWETDGDGFYDLQKPDGPNLRARLRTDASGQYWFRAVRPVSYGIPTDGPVGAMLRATNRHNMRAAHLHFMISAPGHERLVTQLFLTGDQYLDSDAVFGVKESLVVDCVRVKTREEAAKYQVEAPFYRMHYDFVLKPAGRGGRTILDPTGAPSTPASHEGDGMATAKQLPADVYPETLSRLPPLKRETLNEAQQKAYDAVTAPRSGRLNLAGIKGPGGVILRMPKLAKPLGDVNRVLRSELGLDARLVELTILATAREMQSQFEWAMHEPVALEVGVSATTIDIIRHGKPLADIPEKEAALIHLAREAVGTKQVTPATYATALTLFGEEELLHYSALMASYAQAAILLCIVGQELHNQQSPGLPEQIKAMKCGETSIGVRNRFSKPSDVVAVPVLGNP